MAHNYKLDTANALLKEERASVRKARAALAKATAADVKRLADDLGVALQGEEYALRMVHEAKHPEAVAERKASNQATGYGARPNDGYSGPYISEAIYSIAGADIPIKARKAESERTRYNTAKLAVARFHAARSVGAAHEIKDDYIRRGGDMELWSRAADAAENPAETAIARLRNAHNLGELPPKPTRTERAMDKANEKVASTRANRERLLSISQRKTRAIAAASDIAEILRSNGRDKEAKDLERTIKTGSADSIVAAVLRYDTSRF